MESLASLLHLMPETVWIIAKLAIVFLGPLTLAAVLTWAGNALNPSYGAYGLRWRHRKL